MLIFIGIYFPSSNKKQGQKLAKIINPTEENQDILLYKVICFNLNIFHLLFAIKLTNFIFFLIIKIRDMSEYILIAFLVVTLLLYLFYFKPVRTISRYAEEFTKKGYKVYCIPFNPLAVPFFSMRAKNSKNGDALKSYKNEFTSYDLLIGNVFTKPAIQFLSPQVRKQFIKHEVDFCYEKLPQVTKQFTRILGEGILFSEGQVWKRKRRILSKFFSYDFLNSQIPEITRICEDCFRQLEQQNKEQLQKNHDELQIRLIRLTSRIFSSVILTIFLGNQSLEEKIEGQRVCHFVQDLISDMAQRTIQKIPLLLGPKFLNLGLTKKDACINRRKKLFDQWAANYIHQLMRKLDKESSKIPSNLIELLFYEKKEKNDESFSSEQLVDELKVFFFAGSDTTAHFAQMMIYFTARNSEIMNKVLKQIQQIQSQSETNIPIELKKMKYIQCIQKQTLRFFGPIPLNTVRIVTKQHYFNGVKLSKGTSIQFYSISTHYNEDFYSKPFQFRPQRWLNETKELDPMCLVGFGMGPRSCIGQQLALIQSKIAFYMFFNRYKKVMVPDKVELRWRFMHEADNLLIRISKQKSKEAKAI